MADEQRHTENEGAEASASVFIDDRPFAEANSLSSRDLPEDGDILKVVQEMADCLRAGGSTYFRATHFNDEHPSPIYPHGVYLEGWDVAPHKMNPPHRQPPFSYPLIATEA